MSLIFSCYLSSSRLLSLKFEGPPNQADQSAVPYIARYSSCVPRASPAFGTALQCRSFLFPSQDLNFSHLALCCHAKVHTGAQACIQEERIPGAANWMVPGHYLLSPVPCSLSLCSHFPFSLLCSAKGTEPALFISLRNILLLRTGDVS